MVIPADGPSFGVAPSGIWICISLSLWKSAGIPSLSAIDLIYEIPVLADSFMTSPIIPVSTIPPLPGRALTSTSRVTPPTAVHARPFTTPTCGLRSNGSSLYFSVPRYSTTFSLVKLIGFIFGLPTISLTTFLHSLAIVRSNCLTPDSLVYLLIIYLITSSSIVIKPLARPFSLICFFNIYLLTISNFSSSIYPSMSIISILSSRGLGICLRSFAVVINITFDRSNGSSK